jgi:hypothetical protein
MTSSLAIIFFGRVLSPTDLEGEPLKLAALKFENQPLEVWSNESSQLPTHTLWFDFLPSRDGKILKKFSSSKKALIRAEPAVVNPHQYSEKIEAKFNLILDSKIAVESQSSNSVRWQVGYVPENFERELETTLLEAVTRKDRVGLINENKFSLVRGELYGLRTSVIRESQKRSTSLLVAGRNWTQGLAWTLAKQLIAFIDVIRAGLLPNADSFRLPLRKNFAQFLGRVESELDFLRSLDVAIVIENEATYVSEKLTNALLAGCRVVYVGPPLALDSCCSKFINPCEPNPSDVWLTVESVLKSQSPSREEFLQHLKTCYFLKSWRVADRMSELSSIITKWVN